MAERANVGGREKLCEQLCEVRAYGGGGQNLIRQNLQWAKCVWHKFPDVGTPGMDPGLALP